MMFAPAEDAGKSCFSVNASNSSLQSLFPFYIYTCVRYASKEMGKISDPTNARVTDSVM